MRRFYGLIVVVALLAGCGSGASSKSAHVRTTLGNARTGIDDSTTTTAAPTTTTAPATGAIGPTGPPGAPGSPGVSGYQIVQNSRTIPLDDSSRAVGSVDLSVSCPAGKSVLSGGASVVADPHTYLDFAFLKRSDLVDASTWGATADWNEQAFGNIADPKTLTLTVHAICATVSN